jgi:fucose permease
MRSEVIRARNAVAVVFALSGVAMATWLSRIPHVRDQLGLTPGELGRMLLFGACGAIVALPTAGLVVNRIGSRRAVAGGALLMALGAALVGLGTGPAASVVVVSAGLFTIGYGVGTVDVAMNVEGAAVERRLGRAIMPRLHAGFSLGTMVGAGFGALAAATGLPVPVHLGALAIVTVAVALPACRRFLPAAGVPAGPGGFRPAHTSLWAVWREPRTLLVGLMVLGSAFSEGTANEWLAVGLVDGFQVSNAAGAIGYAIFVTAMTVGRIWGTPAIDRFGRVPVLRTSAVLTVAGVLLVVFGGSMPIALAGAVVWGAGAALGFPVGMSAAADDPVRAAVRVSVVSSIGYAAFLAGPPLLGWLGDHQGVQRALLVVVVAAAVSALVAGATREPPRSAVRLGEVRGERVPAEVRTRPA